ncbi:UDP-glucose 4-epimerase GalE [Streptococcus oriscaviae]|uniref:UDP-glucose 4-epimerase n=1 Tax=Streptococcus oriscaviae TaxID=2781599 RepID=A0ABX7YMG5_9STRE|nr:UDP-glucose 4-epimerase GalE [Streptococcus oriscaviae]QUE54454.1 UDP-glucose 4-epimerase GalE [Streptococcus oriscaviae]
MSILVTGGAGYIGSHTVVELLNLGQEVVIVDNLSNSSPLVLDRIEAITGKRPAFYELDVADKDGLRQIFAAEKIEAAIHFAGYKAVGESVEKPIMYYENNIMSTLALVEVMAEFDVKKIVFSSSATVYGLNNPSPLVETMPTSATNPYGYTKVMLEQILRDVEVADNSWSIALLRYFNPIGAHSSGLIGEDPSGIPNNLMPFIAQVAVGKRQELSVFGNDYDTIDGTGVRDYIHVVDLALGHIKALEKIANTKGVHTYNLGSGQGTSVLELVQAFEKVNGIPVPYKIVERRPGDVATCFANADKALAELNWKTEKTIEDMCKDTWNWQSKNPNGYRE